MRRQLVLFFVSNTSYSNTIIGTFLTTSSETKWKVEQELASCEKTSSSLRTGINLNKWPFKVNTGTKFLRFYRNSAIINWSPEQAFTMEKLTNGSTNSTLTRFKNGSSANASWSRQIQWDPKSVADYGKWPIFFL